MTAEGDSGAEGRQVGAPEPAEDADGQRPESEAAQPAWVGAPPRGSEPYGSIIERFRGTPWESPKPELPPPRPRPAWGRLLVIGGVSLLVVAVALLLAWRPGPQPGTAVHNPPPGSVATPGPTATPSASERVFAAFMGLVDDPALSYHVNASGRSDSGSLRERFTLSLDVVGDDYAGEVNTIGGSGHSRIVRYHGVVCVKPDGSDWVRRRTDDDGLRQQPFMGITSPLEVHYLGPKVAGRMVTYQLETTDFYGPSITRMLDLARFPYEPDTVRADIIVSDAGVPVSATFVCVLDGDPARLVPTFIGSADYAFSNFGQVKPIQPPVSP